MKQGNLIQETIKVGLIGIFGVMILVMLIPGLIALCCIYLTEKV